MNNQGSAKSVMNVFNCQEANQPPSPVAANQEASSTADPAFETSLTVS